MNRRKDFIKIKQLISKYNISKLYHFTDYENLESIVKNGGLFSYGDCIRKGIRIAKAGGSELSHELDEREHLQYYVRASFCKRHPMMYSAMQDGRINNPIILEIDTDVLFIDGCIYSNKNAVRSDASKGTSFDALANIHFDTTLQNSQFDVPEDEQEFFQAEVLVPKFIPLHYILNISNYYKPETLSINHIFPASYTAPITDNNPTSILFVINQSYPTNEKIDFDGIPIPKAEAVSHIINGVINKTISENKDGNIGRKLFLDAIGYGDYAYPLGDKEGFLPLQEIATSSKGQPWIKPQSEGNANLFSALRMARRKVENWITEHPDSYPPTIIHITEYRYHGADDSTMVQLANELKFLSTNNGNALFFNIIITAKDDGKALYFPSSKDDLKDSYYGEMYYLLSSKLPLSYNERLSRYHSVDNPCEPLQGFAFMIPFNNLKDLLLSIIPRLDDNKEIIIGSKHR